MSAESAAIDVQTDLVAASRERVAARLSSPERLTHGVTAFAFMAIAVVLAAYAPPWAGRNGSSCRRSRSDCRRFPHRARGREWIHVTRRSGRDPDALRATGRTCSPRRRGRPRLRPPSELHPRPRALATNHRLDRQRLVHDRAVARVPDRLRSQRRSRLLGRGDRGGGVRAVRRRRTDLDAARVLPLASTPAS